MTKVIDCIVNKIQSSKNFKRAFAVLVTVVTSALSFLLDNTGASILGTAVGTLVCFSCSAFAALYFWRSYWKATPAGRSVLYIMCMFALYSLQISVANWGLLINHQEFAYPFRYEVRATINVLILLGVGNLILTLLQLQQTKTSLSGHVRRSLGVDGGERVTDPAEQSEIESEEQRDS